MMEISAKEKYEAILYYEEENRFKLFDKKNPVNNEKAHAIYLLNMNDERMEQEIIADRTDANYVRLTNRGVREAAGPNGYYHRQTVYFEKCPEAAKEDAVNGHYNFIYQAPIQGNLDFELNKIKQKDYFVEVNVHAEHVILSADKDKDSNFLEHQEKYGDMIRMFKDLGQRHIDKINVYDDNEEVIYSGQSGEEAAKKVIGKAYGDLDLTEYYSIEKKSLVEKAKDYLSDENKEILRKAEEIEKSNANLEGLRPNNPHSEELYNASVKAGGLYIPGHSDIKAAKIMLDYLPPEKVAATIARLSPEINVKCSSQAEKSSKAKAIVDMALMENSPRNIGGLKVFMPFNDEIKRRFDKELDWTKSANFKFENMDNRWSTNKIYRTSVLEAMEEYTDNQFVGYEQGVEKSTDYYAARLMLEKGISADNAVHAMSNSPEMEKYIGWGDRRNFGYKQRQQVPNALVNIHRGDETPHLFKIAQDHVKSMNEYARQNTEQSICQRFNDCINKKIDYRNLNSESSPEEWYAFGFQQVTGRTGEFRGINDREDVRKTTDIDIAKELLPKLGVNGTKAALKNSPGLDAVYGDDNKSRVIKSIVELANTKTKTNLNTYSKGSREGRS